MKRESCWRKPTLRDQAIQQQQVGYPRVVGYIAGPGYYPGVGAEAPAAPMMPVHQGMPVHGAPHPAIHSAPWRPMMAPGSPPLGEGHVPIPLTPETFGGVFGAGGAATGAVITFSARPQKPYKLTRLLVRGVKTAGAQNAALVGQGFIGTDLQQGELGNIDLETLGAGGAFDTWLSWKQAEPGVWIRVQATLLGAPTFTTPTTDSATYIITAIGHYLH
jgi:hypothetical protein